MICTETVEIDGVKYLHTYSDAGCYVERDGIAYSDAIDPLDSGRTYTEGEKMETALQADEMEVPEGEAE